MSIEITGFLPQVHGFHFANKFQTIIIPSIDIPFVGPTPEVKLTGLCGGMAFSALDYFFAGLPVPTHYTSDYASGVPPLHSRLFEMIYRRHLNSIGLKVVLLGVVLPGVPIPTQVLSDGLENAVAFVAKSTASPAEAVSSLPAEVAKVITKINAGEPVVIGLVAKGALLQSHQVVVIGYDTNTPGTTRFMLYDNRVPGMTPELIVTPGDAVPCRLERAGVSEPWHTFFVETYSRQIPTYRDLAVIGGIGASLVPGPGSRSFNIQMTVANQGDAPAHPRFISPELSPNSINGAIAMTMAMQVTSLPAGGTVHYSNIIDFPAAFAGETVLATCSFQDATNNPTRIPADNGAQSEVSLNVPLEF
jgi:hypothetical protein